MLKFILPLILVILTSCQNKVGAARDRCEAEALKQGFPEYRLVTKDGEDAAVALVPFIDIVECYGVNKYSATLLYINRI